MEDLKIAERVRTTDFVAVGEAGMLVVGDMPVVADMLVVGVEHSVLEVADSMGSRLRAGRLGHSMVMVEGSRHVLGI